MGTRRLGGWCATPNVETHVTFGVARKRVASRGSGATVAVPLAVPDVFCPAETVPGASRDVKTSVRSPGTTSTRGLAFQMTSPNAPIMTSLRDGYSDWRSEPEPPVRSSE